MVLGIALFIYVDRVYSKTSEQRTHWAWALCPL